jgi:hypothetical protein
MIVIVAELAPLCRHSEAVVARKHLVEVLSSMFLKECDARHTSVVVHEGWALLAGIILFTAPGNRAKGQHWPERLVITSAVIRGMCRIAPYCLTAFWQRRRKS